VRKFKSICIIDDDSVFVFTVKKMIQKEAFSNEIIEYSNGQEALDGLGNKIDNGEDLPEVVLLDLEMPIMDGWEFLDRFIKLTLLKNIVI